MVRIIGILGIAALLTLLLQKLIYAGSQVIAKSVHADQEETGMPKVVKKFAFIGLQILMFMAAAGSLEGF